MTSCLFCYLARQALAIISLHLGASILEGFALPLTHPSHDESPKAQHDCACSGKGSSTQIALCPKQVVVFDLEYGQPAASTTLPTSRPAFRDLLGCFGHADAGKRVLESGVDLLYTSHQVNAILLSMEEFHWHTVSMESAKGLSCGQQCDCAQGRCTSMWGILSKMCCVHMPPPFQAGLLPRARLSWELWGCLQE